jgi:hypothetical protein
MKDQRSDKIKQNRTVPTLKYVLLLFVLHYPFAMAVFGPREQAYWWEGLRHSDPVLTMAGVGTYMRLGWNTVARG